MINPKHPGSILLSAPDCPERKTLDSRKIGFTLETDEQTLRKIDEINEETAEAAQAENLKLALR